MLYSVGRCEGTQHTGHGTHSHVLGGKSNIHILNGVGGSLQESLMYSTNRLKCCFAAPITASVGIDVVPVFGRIIGCSDETIIERLIKCPDCTANRCLSVVAQSLIWQHQTKTNDNDGDRLHGCPSFTFRKTIIPCCE